MIEAPAATPALPALQCFGRADQLIAASASAVNVL